MSKLDEMVRWYRDGIKWTSCYEPGSLYYESTAYKHGFRNGMDDRAGNPRETAGVLMRRA